MSLAEVTLLAGTLPADIKSGLEQRMDETVSAVRTVYPHHFACPSAVGRKEGINTGVPR